MFLFPPSSMKFGKVITIMNIKPIIHVHVLILLVLISALWFAWLVNGARAQREAIASIDKAGGSYWYDWQYRNGQFIANGRPSLPNWLIRLIGLDTFSKVVAVRFDERESMVQMLHLDAFRSGYQHEGRIVGEPVLIRIEDLRDLEEVYLVGTCVTDSDLLRLECLTKLERLSLAETDISDLGLKALSGFPRLRWLDLRNTSTTYEGARQLMDLLPNLVIVGVSPPQ
ncbi:MAG: hypothetical protein ACLQGP_28375 [Isosphaeraceae bacterium]